MKCDRAKNKLGSCRTGKEEANIPDDPLVLLLANVGGYLAIYLASAQCHGQSLRHVLLYCRRDVGVGVGGPNPHFRRALMLEFASVELGEFGATN